MTVERPLRSPAVLAALALSNIRRRSFPRKGFAFPHQQGSTLQAPQKWSCPNCGGDCYGSTNTQSPATWTYYCNGSSLGTQTEQTQGCGYWETAYEPRRQGIKPR